MGSTPTVRTNDGDVLGRLVQHCVVKKNGDSERRVQTAIDEQLVPLGRVEIRG